MLNYRGYWLKTISNTHVGSGEETSGIADNLIQRDPTGIPVINASSLKGALREHLNDQAFDSKWLELLMGSKFHKDDQDTEKTKPAAIRIFDAKLLALPMRSSMQPFFYTTCPSILSHFLDDVTLFSPDKKESVNWLMEAIKKWEIEITKKKNEGFILFHKRDDNKGYIEDFPCLFSFETMPDQEKESFNNLFNFSLDNLALFSDKSFESIYSDYLPVIARNHLEDGTSVNLFYEEVLPRQSLLWFWLGFDKKIESACIESLEKALEKPFQVGGNASIGYGLTQIRPIFSK